MSYARDLYDLTEEREAYKRQSLFEEGIDDSTVDKKIEDILIKEYKGVPKGPISRPSVDIQILQTKIIHK